MTEQPKTDDLADAGVFQLDPSRLLKALAAGANRLPCAAVRDLFEGTPDAGTVILSCELEHHTDNLAHRMTNTDGSVTTWRS